MKQKFLVINCDETDLDELRQRLGERPLVLCESVDEVSRYLTSPNPQAVVTEATSNGEPSVAHSPCSTKSDVDLLVERVLEQSNGCAKSLAARVDLLEQKIIEYSLNRNQQHRKETAAELGISRVTLYNKMKKFGMLGS